LAFSQQRLIILDINLIILGPLAMTVYVNPGFGSYEQGVFDGCSYEENISINHGVTLVGYGTDPSEGDYWIVRNQWGDSWGENGYIRLGR